MSSASMSTIPVELMPISLLRAGQAAWVAELVGDRDHCHRLEELGLRCGAAIEMVQPGTPCIVRLAGSRLCLRHDELTGVLVTQEEPA